MKNNKVRADRYAFILTVCVPSSTQYFTAFLYFIDNLSSIHFVHLIYVCYNFCRLCSFDLFCRRYYRFKLNLMYHPNLQNVFSPIKTIPVL